MSDGEWQAGDQGYKEDASKGKGWGLWIKWRIEQSLPEDVNHDQTDKADLLEMSPAVGEPDLALLVRVRGWAGSRVHLVICQPINGIMDGLDFRRRIKHG